VDQDGGDDLRVFVADELGHRLAIHFRLSIPDASPAQDAVEQQVALSSPSLGQHLRMYSSESSPSEEAWPVSATKASSTSLISSKLTLRRADMAAPSF
jgi:hypothetical protein